MNNSDQDASPFSQFLGFQLDSNALIKVAWYTVQKGRDLRRLNTETDAL